MARQFPGRPAPQGGRIGLVLEDQGLAVINRSNRDIQVNDPEPPFGTVVFQAGNIDPATPKLNCVQFFTRESAVSFNKQAGDALEFLTIPNGRALLLKAREHGDFEGVYQRLRRSSLLDLSQSPAEVRQREQIKKALRGAGMQDHDIPAGASVSQLRKLHQDYIAGRHHIQLADLDGDGLELAELADDDSLGSVDITAPAQASRELAELAELRSELEAMGATWDPTWKSPVLRAKLEAIHAEANEIAARAESSAGEAEAPTQPAEDGGYIPPPTQPAGSTIASEEDLASLESAEATPIE